MSRKLFLTVMITLSCLSGTNAMAQTDPSLNGGLPFQAIRPGSEPMTYSQAVDSVFPNRIQITYAAIPGAHSYALFSGEEFNLFLQQSGQFQQDLDNTDPSAMPLRLPQLDSVNLAIQVEGQRASLALGGDEDQARPEETGSLPPVPAADKSSRSKEERKPIVRRGNRIVLNKSVNFSGWQKQKKQDDSRKGTSEEANNSDAADAESKTTDLTDVVAPPID